MGREGVQISGSMRLNTLLCADDDVIIENSENNLQKSVKTIRC